MPVVCFGLFLDHQKISPHYVVIYALENELIDYAAAHIQHMQKAHTYMNIQLHHVVSDITGVTCMRVVKAIVAGEHNPGVLSKLRDNRCYSNVKTVQATLYGNYQPEHLFAL